VFCHVGTQSFPAVLQASRILIAFQRQSQKVIYLFIFENCAGNFSFECFVTPGNLADTMIPQSQSRVIVPMINDHSSRPEDKSLVLCDNCFCNHNNQFDETYPIQLESILSPKEFLQIIQQINKFLKKQTRNMHGHGNFFVFCTTLLFPFCCICIPWCANRGWFGLNGPLTAALRKTTKKLQKFVDNLSRDLEMKKGITISLCDMPISETSNIRVLTLQIVWAPPKSIFPSCELDYTLELTLVPTDGVVIDSGTSIKFELSQNRGSSGPQNKVISPCPEARQHASQAELYSAAPQTSSSPFNGKSSSTNMDKNFDTKCVDLKQNGNYYDHSPKDHSIELPIPNH
jgi:hypothetical protein